MNESQKQQEMIGKRLKDQTSATSRSSKVNDRVRRAAKRSEREQFALRLKQGTYSRFPC